MDRNGWREGGALLVHAGEIPLLSRAARNLAGVKVIRSEGISLYDLFTFRNLLMTKEAFAKVGEEWVK